MIRPSSETPGAKVIEPTKTEIPTTPTNVDKTDINTGTTNTNTNTNTGGLSTGAKVGLGVGIPILLILIGVAIFVFYRRKQKDKTIVESSKEELGKENSSSGGNLISSPETTSYGYDVAGPASGVPQARISKDGEEDNRPVSRAVSPIGEPLDGRTAGEDDNEMQWILEEERKVRERKEQQQRLPTKGSQSSWDGMTGSAS